jgi:hypothetical protein
VDYLWCVLSDGGSQWMYSGFEHYYFEETRSRWYWRENGENPTREEAWKEWVRLVGK